MATDGSYRIVVSFSPAPREVVSVELTLQPGALVSDALGESGLPARFPEIASMLAGSTSEGLEVGVWGKPRPLEHPLRDGDRVEVYRGLQVDPMDARRRRQQGQEGARRG